MSPSKIRVESLDARHKVIRITPMDTFKPQSDLNLLEQIVTNLTRVKNVNLVIDMRHLTFPTSSFIAYLIEITSYLRRQGGNVLLTNLSETARMNFMTFSPLSFLKSIDSGERIEDHIGDHEGNGETPSLHEEDRNPAGNGEDTGEKKNEYSVDDLVNLDINDGSSPTKENANPFSFDIDDLVDENPAQIKAPQSERIVVHSREDQLYKLTDFVEAMAHRAGFDETEISRIKISVYEAAHNIIEHAYEFDPTKHIQMLVKFDSNEFVITFLDRGKGFDYDPNKDYDAIEAAEEKRTGGFGLHIIKRSMDDVKYEANPRWGNRLMLIKKIH